MIRFKSPFVAGALLLVGLVAPTSALAIPADVHVVNTASDPVNTKLVAPVSLAAGSLVGIAPSTNTVRVDSSAKPINTQDRTIAWSKGITEFIQPNQTDCVSLADAPAGSQTIESIYANTFGGSAWQAYVTMTPSVGSAFGIFVPLTQSASGGSLRYWEGFVEPHIAGRADTLCLRNMESITRKATAVLTLSIQP